MRCNEFQRLSSEYIDEALDSASRERFEAHHQECDACRRRLAGLRDLVGSLREIPRPIPPADLLDSSLAAIDRVAEPELTILTHKLPRLKPQWGGGLVATARRLVVDYEFKLIAYSLGLVISFSMFGGVLASMRPMMSLTPFASSEESVWIRPGIEFVPANYSIPRIHESGAMQAFAINGSLERGDLVVIAEIAADGRGSIVEVLDAPPDSRALAELANAIARPHAFVPAYGGSGRPVSSRVVLFVNHVDVLG